MDKSLRPSAPQRQAGSDAPPTEVAQKRLSALAQLLDSLDETAYSSAAPRSQSDSSHQQRLVQARLGVAGSLFTALRAKHAPTAAHCLRVALGCSSWSLAIEMTDQQRDELEVAALLHDIGKIGVPDHILTKPARLSREEYSTVEKHRQNGLEILAGCCDSREILDIVHYASARFDGGRQGFKLSGKDLPLGARMTSIVDAFDSMTTDHVYRRAMSRERAVAELFECAGSQFDPQLVKQFSALLESDRVKFNSEVARRWLTQLRGDSSNSLWTFGQMPAPDGPLSIESLFQQKLLESMHDGVVFVDTGGRILLWNRAAERLTGISATSVYQKRWSPSLIDMRDENDQTISNDDCPVAYAIQSSVQMLRRLTISTRGQQRLSVNAHVAPVSGCDREPHGAVLVLHDASSQITLEERVQTLHEKATRDPLTQVFNRAEFDETHEMFIETHLERALPYSLIICDIDFFKKVNDTYGHQAGDAALINFASLLRQNCRPGDLVARYGGEEFVMLCADCDNATATERAEEIRRQVAEMRHSTLNGGCITASFGVTEIQGGDSPETMLRRADRALMQAKDLGRNRVVQLGSGIIDNQQPKSRGWFSWLVRTNDEQSLHKILVTSVPIRMAVDKLRGFVADHRAEITTIDENHVALKIDGEHASLIRRHNDRPVAFVVKLTFTEANKQLETSDESVTGTEIEVVIRPMRDRDRRNRNLDARAKHLLISLKSYLMAHPREPSDEEQPPDAGVVEAADHLSRSWLPWK